MKLNFPIQLLSVVFGVMLLPGCQSNTVYFASHYAHSIEHVPAKGGTPQVLIPGPAMVMGLAVAPKEQRLYLADSRSISRWRMDGQDAGAVGYAERISSMAVSEKAGRLYWTEEGQPPEAGRGTVMSSTLQGGDRRVLVSHLYFPKVAVNPSKGLLYWTDHTAPRGVWMAKLDGTAKRQIAAVDAVIECLAVDSKDGMVFWVSLEALPDFPRRITAASFDGSNPKTIVTLAAGFIDGVAVDAEARRIVWLERPRSAPARIQSANFDGTSLKTIHEFTGDDFARAVTVGPPRK